MPAASRSSSSRPPSEAQPKAEPQPTSAASPEAPPPTTDAPASPVKSPRPNHGDPGPPAHGPSWPIWLHFTNLPASTPVTVVLDAPARFTVDFDGSYAASSQLRPEAGDTQVSLSSLQLHPRMVSFEPGEDVDGLCLKLFVAAGAMRVRGTALVPEGAEMRLETAFDDTTLVGVSSWCLRIARSDAETSATA